MFQPCTKSALSVVEPQLIPVHVRESFRLALEEKPGPVHLEIPEDIADLRVDHEVRMFPVVTARRPVPDAKAINQCVKMLRAASTPLLVLGAGSNRKLTSKMLKEFVTTFNIPFICTQMGVGVLSADLPQFTGCAALSANDFCHVAVELADLILIVGHDPAEKPPFFTNSANCPPVVHLNFFAAKVDLVYSPTLDVVGDIGNAIWQIKEALSASGSPPRYDFSKIDALRPHVLRSAALGSDSDAFPLHPVRFVSALRSVLGDADIVCADNGLYKLALARSYAARRANTLLVDNCAATMGAGVASAMAAKLVHGESRVAAVCGDGGFLMQGANEIGTLLEQKLDIVICVLNDNAYGMIKWKQAGSKLPEFGLDLNNPSFAKLAEAYGAHGHLVESVADLEPTLEKAFKAGGVHIVEVPISYDEYGAYLNEELRKEVQAYRDDVGCKAIIRQDSGGAPRAHGEDGGGKKRSSEAAAAADSAASEAPTPKKKKKAEAAKASKKDDDASQAKKKSGGGGGGSGDDAKKFTLAKKWPYYLASEAVYDNEKLEVEDKATLKVVAKVAVADEKTIQKGIDAAVAAEKPMAALAAYERKVILQEIVSALRDRFEELAHVLCIEAGKPIKDSRGEIGRAISTFELAAEETTRIYGEFESYDIAERSRGYNGITRRFPVGACSLIAPFNFPMNLLSHKVAPAIATGCPFVVKPASRTPISALILGEIMSNIKLLPKGAFSILPCDRSGAALFTESPKLKLLSFTGSPGVGWDLKSKAGKKKVVLELGGNAAAIVDDLEGEGLATIVERITLGAFYQSGQSCIGVQRVYVQEAIYERVRDALVANVRTLKQGSPSDDDTFIGPMISVKEAKRLESWIKEAVEAGAKVLVGGERENAYFSATILENVPTDAKVNCEEAFGPVFHIAPYKDFHDAVAMVNDSVFGLQAGVFTSNLHKATYAFENIEAGGVVICDIPSFRVDSQPYGGVKDSGLGREGLRSAILDFTEPRVMMMRNVGKSSNF